MALSGTIQDFGIADIFQLIGQQAKTGSLHLSNGVESVRVLFREGAIVHAETVSTPAERRFGTLLVRAEIVRPEQLQKGLELQKRSLERIGTVLAKQGWVDAATVEEMARLQVTETLYGLFEWSRGTYEFQAVDVRIEDGGQPIKAEHLVMNGIRMTDEWPSIRERLPSYGWLVERVRPLPPPRPEAPPSDPFALTADDGDPIGPSARTIYALLDRDRTVQKLVDISRLGEFETCHAVSELIDQGYVRVLKPEPSSAGTVAWRPRARQLASDAARTAISALVVIAVGAVAVRGLAERKAPTRVSLEDRALQRRIEVVQAAELTRAAELFRLERGHYPNATEQLIEAGLIDREQASSLYGELFTLVPTPTGVRSLPPLR